MHPILRKIVFVSFLMSGYAIYSQQTPSPDEKIPFVCTFSKDSEKSWGDDDFVQTFFFVIPETCKKPIYIRLFDPEIGGLNDENHGPFTSKTKFSIYGGKKAHSDPAAKNQNPVGNYKSGILLSSKVFGSEKDYDNKWYTMGPFNPVEGEYQPEFGGYVFKVIIEGMEGDDGNLYKLFLSSETDNNVVVEGGNTFAYEYSFRLSDKVGAVSHLYPFVGPTVTAVKIRVFDYDNDGVINVVSVAKKGDSNNLETSAEWTESTHKISKAEINTSLDIQFIKKNNVKNNNIVVSISNQYGDQLPFFTTPIGGIPKYTPRIGIKMD